MKTSQMPPTRIGLGRGFRQVGIGSAWWLSVFFLLITVTIASASQYGDFTYTTSASAITIVDYTGSGGAVVIPSTIGDNSVTTIGAAAFSFCTDLASVTIPDSVTTIGGQAFSGCTGLTSVAIGSGVTTIGKRAFTGCTGLTSVTIPASVTTIDGYAFSDCSGLASVTIPGSVTAIEGYVFSGCTGLISVIIPNSVSTIGGNAFSGCSALERLYFKGNAPGLAYDMVNGYTMFAGDYSATAYYLLSTTGWGETYGGLPTALFDLPVVTGAASDITTSAVTLHGAVNPAGLATATRFEYGLTMAYGSTAGVTLDPNNGATAQEVGATITGLPAGTAYHYRLAATNSEGTGYGDDATFSTAWNPPVNDNFANAVPLSANNGTVNGRNNGATTETGEPAHDDTEPETSVWYSFTPVANGTLAIDTHGSAFDTILALYTGSALDSLTRVASNDDDGSGGYCSGTTASLTGGTTYWIAVAGYDSDSVGTLVLNWIFTPTSSSQTITFPALPAKTYGDADFAPGATASSGLVVTYTSSNATVAAIVDGKIHVVGAGPTSVIAAQPGDDNWNAAPPVERSFTVAQKTVTATAENKTRSFGAANPGFSIAYAGFANGETAAVLDTPPTAVCSATATSGIGTYPITASGGSDNNYAFSYVAGTLTITPIIPTVTTSTPVAIGTTTATSGGNVTDSGGAAVTARGVCWSTSATPTVGNAKTTNGAGMGGFTSTLNKLIPGTTYYVRAYATNSAGTGYGEQLSVTTPVSKGADFVVTSIVLSPVVPAVGGKVTATVTVLNQGILSGKAGYLYVWLDKPGTATVGEKGDKSASLSTLKPGASKTVKMSLTAPKTWDTFTLRAFIDAKNGVKEDDEYNNQETCVYDTGLPDFEILVVRLSPELPLAGKTFTAYVTVTNSGEVAGDAGYLDVWADSSVLAAAPVPGPKTKGNKYKTVGVLQPDQQKTITVTGLKTPVGTAWTLGVLIDSRAKTVELNETNNWFEFDYGASDTPPLPPPPPG